MAVSPQFVYTDSISIQALLSDQGEMDSLDDDASGVVTDRQEGYLNKVIGWATSRVNFHCCSQYTEAALAQSNMVNYWATVIAAFLLRRRRGNPVPQSLVEMFEEVLKDLEMVRRGIVQIPDIGYMEPMLPAWSNVRADSYYRLRQIRVERPISDRSPVNYPQDRDISAEFIIDPQ